MDIAMLADKGGVGKTTLSVHLATRLRQLGHDIGLIDLDRRKGSSRWINGAEEPYLPAYNHDELKAVPQHEIRLWDTPAHPEADLKRALADLDFGIVVTDTDVDSAVAAMDLYHQMRRLGMRCSVLVNQAHPTGKGGQELIESLRRKGIDVLNTPVRRYAAYAHAHWNRQAVCDGPYPSADQAWTDIAAVADEALRQLEVAHA